LDRLDELRRVRLEKLARLRALGENPYPYSFDRTHAARDVLDRFPELEEKGPIRVAGRIMSQREMGKAAFAHVQDGSGRIQIYFKRDIIGADRFEILKLLDLGDLIGVEGVPFARGRGDLRARREADRAVQGDPAPPIVKEKDGERFDNVTDKELRYRQRHADLILNPTARRSLETRTRVVRHLREFLDRRDSSRSRRRSCNRSRAGRTPGHS